MDIALILEKFKPLLKQNWLALALGIVGLILFIYGLISLLISSSKKSDLILQTAGNVSTESSKLASQIAVDVEGAVAKPGMFKLSEESRIQDLLIISGGLSKDADRSWVEKNLNLAAKLSDGAKIYIPRVGEPQKDTTNFVQTGASSGQTSGLTALINVNTATSSELDVLPGVGPVTAEKIISNRPYKSIDELLSKKVVTSKVFSGIKDKVTVQ